MSKKLRQCGCHRKKNGIDDPPVFEKRSAKPDAGEPGKTGTLYVVATPIGLDITRAIRILLAR